jgi:holo-[acyl-carrier protein] synthase
VTVLGIGVDVVDVVAFTAQLDDPASGFVAATFTPAELAPSSASAPASASASATPRALRLAGRFAAKEAFVKAWSAARYGQAPALGHLDLRQVEVVADSFGRPALRLHGAVAEAVAQLGAGRLPAVHLSISHDGPTAVAMVVLDGPA